MFRRRSALQSSQLPVEVSDITRLSPKVIIDIQMSVTVHGVHDRADLSFVASVEVPQASAKVPLCPASFPGAGATAQTANENLKVIRFTGYTVLEESYPPETPSTLFAHQIVEPSFEPADRMPARESVRHTEPAEPVPPTVEFLEIPKLP
jgi:hypothetical protein